MKKRLFVDMDGTLARFHNEVNYLERMYEEGFFANLKPYKSAVDAIRMFMQKNPDVEVYILSSTIIGYPPFCEAEKNAWLDRYLPEIDRVHRIFPTTRDEKTAFIKGGVTSRDYLLDDYNHNLEAWELAGGHGIKCHNDINHLGLHGSLWRGDIVHTADEAEKMVQDLSGILDDRAPDDDLAQRIQAAAQTLPRAEESCELGE